MKKLLNVAGLMIITLAVVFFLGPKPKFEALTTFERSSMGEDLDQYLTQRESNIPNLKIGAEKEIVWANPETKEQSDLAIIYIHGFSATKHEIQPVPDRVAEAFNANLYYTRLVGSGRDGAGLNEATIGKWLDDYDEAIAIGERIGKKLVIITTSNGSSITTYCLNNPKLSKNVIGFISVSGAYELQAISNRIANMPWIHTLVPIAMGEEISWEPSNEEQAKWWTSSYPITATYPMMTLMNKVWHTDKSSIKTPALFYYSPKDEVVRPNAILKTVENWGGKTEVIKIKETTDPRNHILAGDIVSPENTDMFSKTMIEWIKRL